MFLGVCFVFFFVFFVGGGGGGGREHSLSRLNMVEVSYCFYCHLLPKFIKTF